MSVADLVCSVVAVADATNQRWEMTICNNILSVRRQLSLSLSLSLSLALSFSDLLSLTTSQLNTYAAFIMCVFICVSRARLTCCLFDSVYSHSGTSY